MGEINLLEMIPANVQTYANFMVAIVVGGVGIYGYYKKIRGETVVTAPANTSEDMTVSKFETITNWLKKIHTRVDSNAEKIDSIQTILAERAHREELEREYQRGREDAEDRRREREIRESGKLARSDEIPPSRKV